MSQKTKFLSKLYDHLPYALPVAYSLIQRKKDLLYGRVVNYLLQQEHNADNNLYKTTYANEIDASMMNGPFRFSVRHDLIISSITQSLPRVHNEQTIMPYPFEKKIRQSN